MKSRILSFLLALVLAFPMLTACSSSNSTPSAVSDASETLELTTEPIPPAEKYDTLNSTGESANPENSASGENEIATAAENTPDSAPYIEESLLFGDARFDEYLPLLEGKRVALFSNQSGIVNNDTENEQHILDALVERNVDVTVVFSPEHGFRGTADAGAEVDDSIDEKTQIPIISVHGIQKHSPSQENMDKFDVLIVDIQDVGLRFYTYYISMFYLMDSCAKYDKDVIILDRPNPNGFYVDGPILQPGYESQVGMLPIPVVHGMTLGELALMINGEGWLPEGKDSCKLTVIPCTGYSHEDKIPLAKRPSPNLKDMRAVYLYSSICFFENTAVSVARGTEFPFEAYGSPYLQGVNKYDFSFNPVSMESANNPPYEGKECYGRDLREIPLDDIFKEGINLSYLIDAYNDISASHPDVNFWGPRYDGGKYWIDYLSGSDTLRKQIESGLSAEEIKAGWQDDIDSFLARRAPYLLYH